jgi:hypothetical protein
VVEGVDRGGWPDPERIDAAQRAGTRRRLTLDGVTEATADAWIEAWAAQAARDGIERGAAYWDAAWQWITAERHRRAKVPPGRAD